eukprot:TRINITY_DN22192_c0_g1_i1.p1 TRINITY_DN22192_c0_g1~~TRINITY_DN22192_c0_g1_i1.p1  ORF type:complete len:453 (-),score=125.49 TRINITY_DN22192_c0_g1_i1:113-1471(-)
MRETRNQIHSSTGDGERVFAAELCFPFVHFDLFFFFSPFLCHFWEKEACVLCGIRRSDTSLFSVDFAEQIKYRDLNTKDDKEQEMCIEHWNEVFEKTPKEYFQRHVEKNPMNWICPVFCAFDQDTLVSTVKVFNRAIFVQGDIVSMGGVAEVATKESYRGQGIATTLMEQTIAYMEGRGIFISMLGAAPGAMALYKKLGYTNIPQVIANSSWSDWNSFFANERFTNAVTIQSVDPNELTTEQCGQMKVLSNATAARLNGALIRTQDYFSSWVVAEASLPGFATLLAVDSSQDIQAYMIVSASEKNGKSIVRVHEFCVKDEYEEQGIAEFQLLLQEAMKTDAITEFVEKQEDLSVDQITVQIPMALLSYSIQQRVQQGNQLDLTNFDPESPETAQVDGTSITLGLECGTMFWTSDNFASRMAEKECDNVLDFLMKPSQEGQVYPYYYYDLDCY